MSESKHTPGPWKAYGFMITGGDFRQVADCNMPVGTPGREEDATVDEDQANARLIAAAPALLESLRELLECMDDEVPVFVLENPKVDACLERARSAINKATGGES